jgi:hypothetical protein
MISQLACYSTVDTQDRVCKVELTYSEQDEERKKQLENGLDKAAGHDKAKKDGADTKRSRMIPKRKAMRISPWRIWNRRQERCSNDCKTSDSPSDSYVPFIILELLS